MITISEDADLFTQIIVFHVQPTRARSLADGIVSEVERWVSTLPGFVSSTFHVSLDGTRVVNYAQWLSEAAFRAFAEDPRGEAIGRVIEGHDLVAPPDIHAFRVYRAVE